MTPESVWLIAGVGTGVGKTVVAAGLAGALRRSGADVQVIKPVQTGFSPSADGDPVAPDVATCLAAAPDIEAHAILCFAAPCSPALAARLEGREIVPERLIAEVRTLAARKAVSLIEAAGGLLTPIGEDYRFIDLAADLSARVVLVVDNRLGAINGCLLSLEALRGRGLGIAAVVANQAGPDHGGDGLDAVIRADNLRAIRCAAAESPTIELPHCEGLSSPILAERSAAWLGVEQCLKPLAELIREDRPGDAEAGAVLDFDREHLWHPYAPTHPPAAVWPAAATSGCRIRLADGRELVDGMSSWWAAIHGYNHPALLAALRRQAAEMPHVMFGGLTHRPAAELGKRLLDLAPKGMDRVFLVDSGSVAVEAALKMALQCQASLGRAGKRRFLAPLGGYHGDTLGAMSVCDPVNGMHRLFAGTLPEQIFVSRFSCPFHGEFEARHAADLEDAFAGRGGEIAAAIVEPVAQGAGGMWFYHPEYLRRLRRLCDAHGVLLIFDEIATGFGRTGKMFAAEWAGVVPDIMCVGKALTGGVMTLAAVLCGDAIASAISRSGVFMHGPTFMANPLACAVAAASLDLLVGSPWRENVARIEHVLMEGLGACRGVPGVADVRVLGAIGVVEMERAIDAARLQGYFVERGVWIRPFGKLLYLMPPYVIGPGELETLIAAVRSAVETGQWE